MLSFFSTAEFSPFPPLHSPPSFFLRFLSIPLSDFFAYLLEFISWPSFPLPSDEKVNSDEDSDQVEVSKMGAGG